MTIDSQPSRERRQRAPWRRRLYTIIFEADSRAGKAFDVALLWAIAFSVLAVLLESVRDISASYGGILRAAEWLFTFLFTLEYGLRLASAARARSYATSFFGVVDLLSILPTYLSLVVAGTPSLLVIRALRLLRVSRVLKLARYLSEAGMLAGAIRGSARKILVFLGHRPDHGACPGPDRPRRSAVGGAPRFHVRLRSAQRVQQLRGGLCFVLGGQLAEALQRRHGGGVVGLHGQGQGQVEVHVAELGLDLGGDLVVHP
jgi:hypothetical protein